MMRALFAICCFGGLILGAAFAPAVGIQTPVPDLGVDGDGDDDFGESLLADQGDADQGDENERTGEESQDDHSDAPGENPGTDTYGGVSSGGYPDETTIGGELELSDHPELVVRAPEQTRWRLGAYSTYNGDGFERQTGETEPLTGEIPTDGRGTPEPRYVIQAEPQRPMNALATVWRPAHADADQKISVTSERGLTVDEPIEAGETYVTLTYGPPSREEAAERSRQGSYPPEIEHQYTQLPDDTPDRLTHRTESIAEEAGAETPFETAQAVDTWLKTNKEYTLDATHDRSNDVADEFVFEMEAGYCQYFATAMTTMLRTQGIPARYVTGYSSGERIGDDEYLVRGKNAHAWVEVYISDVGWVTFDPTPGDGRIDAGRDDGDPDELGEQPPEEPDAENDERDEPDDRESDEQDDTEEETTEEVTDDVSVELTPDPVPGREVTATVTQDGSPVSAATVLFNGDPIGETDSSGNVTGEVPYSSSLDVEVRIDTGQQQFNTASRSSSTTLSESVRRLDSRTHRGSAEWGVAGATTNQLASRNTTVSFEVPTEIEIEPLGEPVAGATLDIEATIDDEPVRDGDVLVANETVTQTDDDGVATVELPEAETVTIAVERDDASGNRTLNLTQPDEEPALSDTDEASRMNISVQPTLFVALPGTTATLNVTADGTPIENATIGVNEQSVGETASDGTIGVSLPVADSATITAAATVDGEQATETATVEGMYRNLASVIVFAAIGIIGLFAAAHRRGVTPRKAGVFASRIVTGTVRLLVASVVGFGRSLEAIVASAIRLGHRVIELLSNGVTGVISLIEMIQRGAVTTARRIVTTLRTIPKRLHPRSILAVVGGFRRSAVESVRSVRSTSKGSSDTPSGEALTVRQAWDEFRNHVSLGSWRTSTPGEVARWAVDRDGLPPDPVRTLRDAFRDVEYGGRPQEPYSSRVSTALEQIRASQQAEDDGDES